MVIPREAKRIPLRPLAFGEVTGHNHRLISDDGAVAVEEVCELYQLEESGGAKKHFLRVTAEGISLIHAAGNSTETADHHPHCVPPGEYEVIIQEETTDWGSRQVAD